MALFKNARSWFYALLKTVIGGVSGGVVTSVGARVAIPNTVVDFSDMWKLAIVSAISTGLFNFFFYLQKSPLPDEAEEAAPGEIPPVKTSG